ncbi:AMP-binding protein [Flavisphingomonas formosensis]|uniref:AMP-binding protein n=1 Tax=Flavisphingomonas formosensis TaxID=861534 RepID=UPI0012FAFC98|nr:AMP-binding protein [Sphingomonas formosensis]
MTQIDTPTVYAAFQRACDSWADHDFLFTPAEALDGEPAFARSFGQAAADVEALKARYRAAGLDASHRVGIAMGNHPAFFLHFLALNALGTSVAPLNEGMQDAELADILVRAELDLVIASPAAALRLAPLCEGRISLCRSDAEQVPTLQRAAGDEQPGPASEAALLFTSGSTGTPKGCILSNAYFTQVGHFYATMGGLCAFRLGEDRILTPLPVTHMNALVVTFMAAIYSGSCLIQLDRFHASRWWRTLAETRATIVHYLGVMPAILLQRDDGEAAWRGHQVRFAFGAGVDPRHHRRFEERSGIPLIEAWAMSETGAAAWITANHEPRHVGTRCFGKPPANLDWRIVRESGEDAAVGEPGELLVRARGADPRRCFFSGYHNDPVATEEAWAGGWFHTGDIVRRDASDSLYFVDRLKNIVRRSGENIAAIEVEGALLEQPQVAGCCVLPVLDEIRGEEVMALIQLAGAPADEARARAIAAGAASRLAYYKVPGYIAFVDALPTTASQKLQRGALRQLGRDLVAAGSAFDLRDLKRKRG